MKVITAADCRILDWYQLWREAVERVGFDWTVYDLGGLGAGKLWSIPVGDLERGERNCPPCTFKPSVILDALREWNEPILWLDVDAVLLRRFDPREAFGTCDVAVTVRPDWCDLPWIGSINAGVVYVASESFAGTWLMLSKFLGSDQHALNEICGYPLSVGDHNGLLWSLRTLPTGIWNCSEEDGYDSAVIYHFKDREANDYRGAMRRHNTVLKE